MMNKKAAERDREQGESGIKMNKERQREKTGKKIDAALRDDLSKGSSLKTQKERWNDICEKRVKKSTA